MWSLRSHSIAVRYAHSVGQFLANVVHEAYAAKATMTSLRSEVFYSRFARLETKTIWSLRSVKSYLTRPKKKC